MNNYIKRHKENIKSDLYELLYDSLFFDKSNLDSYVKSFYFLFYENDIETSIQKLIPLLENSTKYICEKNGINPYRLSISKKSVNKYCDETNMFGYLWKHNLFKEIFGDVIVFNVLSIFDSKYGINLRNSSSHGELSSNEYRLSINYYAIFFILWLCVYYKNKTES